jgi:hypothetical protein
MVIDYREGARALAAQRALADAGIAAQYTPDKLVPVSPDPVATHWVIHRLEVAADDCARARAILDEFGLTSGPGDQLPA